MDTNEAHRAIEDLRRKGWSFSIHIDEDGWNCEVVGAGLAHGRYGGCPFEEAVDRAIAMAKEMEDDPEVVLARHRQALDEAARKAYGPDVKYRIEVQENKWEWGPKRIHFIVQTGHSDVQKHVDQEMVFIGLVGEMPREIFLPLLNETEWPDREETCQKAGS